MTDLRKVLAVNIKHFRKTIGFSQAALAELVDVSENYIALIETCRRFPSISTLEQLAVALKVDILELFSIKTVELPEKKAIKSAILADIDNILTMRLLDQ